MSAFPAFIGGAYRSQSYVSDNEALINWYIEAMESPGATSPASLYPTPGFQAVATFDTSGGRAAAECLGRVFVVFGSGFYEVSASWGVTPWGTLAVDSNPATICTNGDGGGQVFITSGGNGYCFDLDTNVFTQVLTGDATQGGMLYGYFVAFDRVTSTIRISDLFDGLTWDPTQFAQRTIGADPWNAMLVTPYGYIFLPGTKTGEFWYNAGTFPFPFAPDPSGLIEEGIAATFSIRQAAKTPVWLSRNANGGYRVMRATGFTPERISNHALEYALSQYGDVSDALGETYEERGHEFYLLTLPRQRVTWAYDFTTRIWGRRGVWIAEESRYDYWRPVFHCFAFAKHLMVDRSSNVLYWMSDDFGLDVEERPIRRLRRSPAVIAEHQRLTFPEFELLMETGIGTASGASQDQDPHVMLRYSNDFGQTWGSERQAAVGKLGQYWRRVRWLQCGSGRGRVWEVSVSAEVPWRITAAFQKVQGPTDAVA
ncbi:MAG: hypothetical protein IT429_03145 [Gemmataceae bacterium]|nr:hypothetical protein [Gemmataceae bacterium]